MPEVWGRSNLESKGSQVDHSVGDEEEHGDNGGYGVQLAQEEGDLWRGRREGGGERMSVEERRREGRGNLLTTHASPAQ